MGRDTIPLEDAVSTISEEYLLKFTLEYGILESLHPELSGPEETIVDFSNEMDLFNLISAPNPAKDEFSCEIPTKENPTTTKVIPELEKEVVTMGPHMNKRCRKTASDEADVNVLPKVLRKDHAAVCPE
ncbi:hypothetical protein Tco_0570017 [Tanacetum coccineum]